MSLKIDRPNKTTRKPIGTTIIEAPSVKVQNSQLNGDACPERRGACRRLEVYAVREIYQKAPVPDCNAGDYIPYP